MGEPDLVNLCHNPNSSKGLSPGFNLERAHYVLACV